MSPTLYEELQALVGQEGPVLKGNYPVCRQMIRHWCEAMEDDNPLYTNEEYARKTEYKGLVAPDVMIQVWTMGTMQEGEMRNRHPEMVKAVATPDPGRKALDKLNAAGFVGTVATGTTLEFFKPLFPGDTVTMKVQLSLVSQEKKTGRGVGHFVTTMRVYSNQKGELVCNQSFTVLKFKPPQK